MRFENFVVVVAMVFACAFGIESVAHAVIIEDFSSVNRSDGTIGDIDAGWHGKSQTTSISNDGDWMIQSGQMVQVGESGSETRVLAAFSIDSLTGSGWTYSMDLTNEADDIDVWFGKDDGNNTGVEGLGGTTGDGGPSTSIVSNNSSPLNVWLNPVALENWDPADDGAVSVELTGVDLSDYDIMVVKISNRSGGFITFDNIELTQVVPEPSTISLTLFAATLLGFVAWRRRSRVNVA